MSPPDALGGGLHGEASGLSHCRGVAGKFGSARRPGPVKCLARRHRLSRVRKAHPQQLIVTGDMQHPNVSRQRFVHGVVANNIVDRRLDASAMAAILSCRWQRTAERAAVNTHLRCEAVTAKKKRKHCGGSQLCAVGRPISPRRSIAVLLMQDGGAGGPDNAIRSPPSQASNRERRSTPPVKRLQTS